MNKKLKDFLSKPNQKVATGNQLNPQKSKKNEKRINSKKG